MGETVAPLLTGSREKRIVQKFAAFRADELDANREKPLAGVDDVVLKGNAVAIG